MHVCLFDIDGTLVNTGGAGRAAFETALLERFGLSAIADEVQTTGRTDRAIAADLFRIHEIEDSPGNWDKFRATYLTHLGPSLETRQGTVLPGIVELLEGLARRDDVTVGLLTGNIRDGARIKLEFFGLFEHVNLAGLGGFGDVHHDRDSVAREALDVARRHFNGQLAEERVWVIGDTPLDVACARAIGANAVAVATGTFGAEELVASEPDLLIENLTDPGPLMERLV